ncbi:MAG: VOC family protein [Paraglaciecola sp.]|uniref:VOC family protein n=1 Tax=Paraglaciecola sp. TaxID=1920173 RepID=UPI00273E92E4|nr:VOC family protein [Paraglaciecola sp.]MDP5033034.1 VOC family protein [Paraglaciecola sp.]MDP5133719.1 VOC family protein [Paraglaciecola sp.]
MNIIGPDKLIWGVEDLAAAKQFAVDYGLTPQNEHYYSALDGTGIEIRAKDDKSLPAGLTTGSMLRKTVYGVKDQATLDAIKAEFTDREVKVLADGSLELVDDMGFVLGFQITIRTTNTEKAERVNAPGDVNREINQPGVTKTDVPRVQSLSHVVYFVPDSVIAEAFFANRLGFVTTDRFTGVGPFMRPAATQDHHTIFFIQAPAFMQGCEHFTFHMAGPTDVVQAGTNMVNKGYQSFWGPGRHLFGSNWFWYFKSPFGCNMEYDADMDQHDESWQGREAMIGPDNSQAFLLQYREKWAPGPGGPKP